MLGRCVQIESRNDLKILASWTPDETTVDRDGIPIDGRREPNYFFVFAWLLIPLFAVVWSLTFGCAFDVATGF